MAYIGRDIEYGTFTKQVITPPDSSTTVYTLDQSVGNARNLIVSIGGVIQEPDVAFTAVGTVLTFTSAPAQGSIVWLIYLGKEIGSGGTRIGSTNFQSENGNGSTTPFALTKSATNSASILVTLNGIVQVPDTDYTASNLVLTFTTAPDATHDIMVYHLDVAGKINTVADGSVTAAALAANGTWPAWNGSALTNLTAGNLNGGVLPALDASNITNLTDSLSTETTSDPLLNSNPSNVGHMWLNTTTGELFCCTDNTANNNVWKNIGEGSGNVSAPTNPTNTGTFTASETGGTTFTFQFSGGVVASHYLVDNITGGSLTVTTAEVADGASHEFVTTMPGSGNDTVHTFRVRTKNAEGFYSSGITVSFTILATIYTTATGGTKVPVGDYYVHTFTSSSSFNVTQVGTDNTIEYLLVGNGGGGGAGIGGGGGAGQYLSVGSYAISVSNYNVTIGGGGAGSSNANSYASQASSTTFGSITAVGGGGGAGWRHWNSGGNSSALNGASGGGAGGDNGSHSGGTGTHGNNGGSGGYSVSVRTSGGGGGAASAGGNAVETNPASCGNGGAGYNNTITGSSVGYAGGGGGGNNSYQHAYPRGTGSHGGGDGNWELYNPPGGQTYGTNGTSNTGGGGGGGGETTGASHAGKNGGSGILVVKYKYQN